MTAVEGSLTAEVENPHIPPRLGARELPLLVQSGSFLEDRPCLLRQLGGFQSIGGVVKEGFEAKQLAASDLKKNPNLLIEHDAAPPAVETDLAQRCDEISRVMPILEFQGPLVELLVDLTKVATDARSTVDRFAQEPAHQHHVRVDLFIPEPPLASVPPAEHTPGEVDVLLRHRPRSIPLGEGGNLEGRFKGRPGLVTAKKTPIFRTRYGPAQVAERPDPTTITFANGSELKVIAPPDEIAAAIDKANGRLLRLLDTNENGVWINPEHVVHIATVASEHVRPVSG